MTSAEKPRGKPDVIASLEQAAAWFFAQRFALPLYLIGSLLVGAVWWRVTTWLNPSTWWPWPYFVPQFTVTYGDNGFTRRAIVGTVGQLLQIEPSPDAVKLFYVTGVIAGLAALLTFGWIATRTLRPLERFATLALLTPSPATILHWMEDPGRLDAWVVCFAAIACMLTVRRAYLFAAVAAALAGLIHESYFIVFGFLALAVFDERRRQGAIARDELIRAGAALLALAALFAYLALFGSADMASLQLSAARLGQQVEFNGFNLYYSYLGFEAHPRAWASCFMQNDAARLPDLILTLTYVALQAYVLFAWTDRPRRLIAAIAVLGPAVMAIVALDLGRYAAFASTGLWLYLFMTLQTDSPASILRPVPLFILIAITALGPLGVTDGYQSLRGLLDAIFGAHAPLAVGAICTPQLR